MIKIKDYEVVGLKWALKAMREPYESMDRSDSVGGSPFSGKEDMKLARRLIKGGTEHSKFTRFPDVYIEISAPLEWWTQFDTYRYGVEKSSSSTMHLLMSRELSLADFATDSNEDVERVIQPAIDFINYNGLLYRNMKSKDAKRDLLCDSKAVLPSSFMQERIVKVSYQALMAMYKQRKDHRLPGWGEFCDWIISLPYMSEFIGEGEKEDGES